MLYSSVHISPFPIVGAYQTAEAEFCEQIKMNLFTRYLLCFYLCVYVCVCVGAFFAIYSQFFMVLFANERI